MIREKRNYFLKARGWKALFEGEDPPSGDPPSGDPPPKEPPPGKTYSDTEVKNLLEKERQKLVRNNEKTIQELEALKERSALTNQERVDLDQRIEILSNDLLTEKERAEKDKKRLETKFQTDLQKTAQERDDWKNRFERQTIRNEILASASKHEAWSPTQLVALIEPKTILVEDLDEDGKPTGEYVPKVKFEDVDSKTGKPVTVQISVSEAVKRMKDIEEHQNLFKGLGVGGLNGTNKPSGTKSDLARLATTDPEAYRKARKAGATT